MHTQAESPNLTYRTPSCGRTDVTPRRLQQRATLARGICQECCTAPRAVDVSGVQCVLCAPCRDRQNAARRNAKTRISE